MLWVHRLVGVCSKVALFMERLWPFVALNLVLWFISTFLHTWVQDPQALECFTLQLCRLPGLPHHAGVLTSVWSITFSGPFAANQSPWISSSVASSSSSSPQCTDALVDVYIWCQVLSLTQLIHTYEHTLMMHTAVVYKNLDCSDQTRRTQLPFQCCFEDEWNFLYPPV